MESQRFTGKVILATLILFGAPCAAAGQSPDRFVGLTLSEPYKGATLGFDGRWAPRNGRWFISSSGSGLVGDYQIEGLPWLVETLASVRVANSGIGRHLLFTSGLRLTDSKVGPREAAVPILAGLRVPFVSRESWDLSFEGYVGVDSRWAGTEHAVERAMRFNFILGSGHLQVNLGYEDAGGPTSPFTYTGAGRMGISWRLW